MTTCPATTVAERPEPPTREAIEREREKQLECLQDLRRKLIDTRGFVIPRVTVPV